MPELNPHRLPRQVIPTHYALTLEPDLKSGSFEGTVSIELDVISETDTVVLNAAELTIENASVDQDGAVAASSVAVDEGLE